MLTSTRGLWGAIALGVVFAAPVFAQEGADDEWSFELSAATGIAVLSYEESLGTVESEYVEPGYTFRMSLQGNLAGVAPYLGFETAFFFGKERFDRPGLRQENDSEVATYFVDLGCGYRINVDDTLTLVPGLGYTYGLLAFTRSDFDLNGVPGVPPDLDGAPQSSVDEDIFGHGMSGRFALEAELGSIDLGFHLDYTYYFEMKVINDIGGTTHTEGGMLRTGVTATFWLGPSFGVVAGGEFTFMSLDKSRIEIQGGAATVALVQYPNSETFGGTVSIGIRARF